MLRQFISRFLGDISGEMLKTTAKTIAWTAIFSASVAWYVAEKTENDRSGLANLFSAVSGNQTAGKPGVDMSTTASIRNQSVKLDPCEVQPKR